MRGTLPGESHEDELVEGRRGEEDKEGRTAAGIMPWTLPPWSSVRDETWPMTPAVPPPLRACVRVHARQFKLSYEDQEGEGVRGRTR